MLLGLPRTYWVIWTGALVNRLGGFVFTFLALYLTEARHFSALDAGTAVASYGVGSFAAAAFGGWLADRKGRRFGILFGTVTGAASLLVLGAMDTLLLVRVAAFFAGFFGDSYRPALNAAIADVVPPLADWDTAKDDQELEKEMNGFWAAMTAVLGQRLKHFK